MKKLLGNTGAKIIAVILSFVLSLVFVFSAASIAVMGYYKFYFSNIDTVKEEILTDMAQSEANHISNLLDRGTNLKKYYSDKNVRYIITDRLTKEVVSANFKEEPYIATAESNHYSIKDVILVDEKTGEEYTEQIWEHSLDITVYITEDMHYNDLFSVASKMIEIGFKMEYWVIFIMVISLLSLIAVICFLFCAAGHSENGKMKLGYIDILPFDVYTFIVAAAVGTTLYIANDFMSGFVSMLIVSLIVGSVDYFILIIYLLSFATRIKMKTLIKNTLIYRLFSIFVKMLKKIFSWFSYIFSNLSLIYKTLIIVSAIGVVNFILLVIYVDSWRFYNPEPVAFVCFLLFLIFASVVIYLAIILQKIKIGGEKIAKGDLQHKIDTKYMFGDFKNFAKSLNNINKGLAHAVNEKMKSERFKTELITNVSHDIKTPLTSIINYVDLIKKENSENENIKEYISVLDRQSTRLKKLVEDLVEASKASSGSLAVNLIPCDIKVLLSQTLGEFEDRLNAKNLNAVINSPENSVIIMADGRHLWRIFDNLMGNICKYALEGTRVYIDIESLEEKVTITFRNISKNQLNVSADELMERFVRGDSSRNTEGSGLGLSIARSLAELQNGNFDVAVDGDLFKVTLTFKKTME